MKTKNLLKPKKYVHTLSKDKIDAEPLFWLIGMTILTFFIGMFGFEGDGIKLTKATLAPLNQISGPERLSSWINVITGMIGIMLLYVLVYVVALTIANLLVKATLKLFKKEVSLWKLMNITIYALLINKFLVFIFTFAMVLLAPSLGSISESQTLFIISIPLLFYIVSFILYSYSVAWTTKNKFISL